MQIHLLLSFLLFYASMAGNIQINVRGRSVPPTALPENGTTPSENQTLSWVSNKFCLGCFTESLEFLFAHNLARARHLELPLVWDFQVEKYAKWWAGQRKSDCKLEHSFPNETFLLGENIYWGSGSSWTPSDAVRAWVDEEKYYSYATNSCLGDQMCGHYTQVVWKSSRRLGCARVLCDSGDVFMTCNYDPPGNYIGERPY